MDLPPLHLEGSIKLDFPCAHLGQGVQGSQHLLEHFKELPGGQKYCRSEKKLYRICAHLSVAINATCVFSAFPGAH